MKKVSVIISTKNSGTLLKSCLINLDEIKSKHYDNLEVIVVDNKSVDNTRQILKDKFSWVKVVDGNDKGNAAANNLGAKQAVGDYFLFLSPDGYPRFDTITNLVKYLEEHSKVGMAMPKLSLQGGRPDEDAHRSFPTPWNAFTRLTGLYKLFPKSKTFNSYYMGNENPNAPHEIDAGVSGFMLMPKKTFEDLNGFDEDYYAFGEDLDICYRLKQKGYTVMYLPQWESGHFKTRLNPETATLAERIKLARGSTDAMRIFLRKNYKNTYPKGVLMLMNTAINMIEMQRVAGVILSQIFK